MALVVNDVTASWGTANSNGDSSVPVIRNMNFTVEQGQVVCLTGPNGSGKSTLMSVMSGNTDPSLNCTGTVLVDDKRLQDFNRKQRACTVASLSQNESSLWNYTVRDVVLTGRFCHTSFSGFYSDEDQAVVDSVIKRVQIEQLRDRRVFELSGGEFQKVRIARCLAQQSKYILLDEPVANLDFGYEKDLLNLLTDVAREQNIGILISIHDLNTACRFADKMVLLCKGGSYFSGTVEQVMTVENLKECYKGVDFGTFVHPHYNCIQVYTL